MTAGRRAAPRPAEPPQGGATEGSAAARDDGVALADIAAHLGATLVGDASTRIRGIAALDAAGPSDVAFLANPRYAAGLATTRAAAVLVAPSARDAAAARGAALVADDPYAAYARLTQWWAARTRPGPVAGIHPTALVDPAALLAADVSVGAGAVVEAGVQLGDGVVIGALAFVGRGTVVGAGSRLEPRSAVLHGCVLGARVVVGSGAVIGGDGFGFAPTAAGPYEKIEQLGRVVLEDGVDIGCNTTVDRGALGDTVIGAGAKIDNLVQIAHNVTVGEHTVIAGCTGIAGSTRIGARCRIGGGVGIAGHISIADGTTLIGATQVSRTIARAGVYGGPFPFDDNVAWEKNAATLRKLHLLRQRVIALEKALAPATTNPIDSPDARTP